MPTNRYFNRKPYEGSFYTPPVDLIASQLDFAQKKYDENYAIANQIKSQFIDSLPQDRKAANELQDRYSKSVDDIVKQYNGDFSKAGRGLNDFLYGLKKEYNPGGKAYAIVTRKQTWDKWLGRQQERVGKDLTGEQLTQAYNYYYNNINPIGEKDPVTGAYESVNVHDLSSFSDANQIYQDAFSKLKPSKFKEGITTPNKNGYDVYHEVEKEGFQAAQLQQHFASALMNDPKQIAYLREQAMFSGLTPDQIEARVNDSVRTAASNYAYMNTSDLTKMDPNKFALEAQRAKNDRANIKYKHDLEAPAPQGVQYQYEPATNQLNKPLFNIDDVNWRSQTYSEVNTLPMAGAMGVMVAPTRLAQRQYAGTLDDFFKTADAKKLGVDPILAEDVLNTLKQERGVSGTNYSKSFEQDFWGTYKQAHADNATQQGISRQIPEPARDNVVKGAVRSLLSGNGTFYKPGEPGYIANTHNQVSKEELVDDKGNPREDLYARYVEVGPGFPSAGTLITTNKGNSFVIVDQNTERSAQSAELAAGLNPIFNGTSRIGAPIPFYQDDKGQKVYGKPFITHERGADGRFHRNFNIANQNGDVHRTSLTELYDNLVPVSERALGYGASKSDNTPFKLF